MVLLQKAGVAEREMLRLFLRLSVVQLREKAVIIPTSGCCRAAGRRRKVSRLGGRLI